MLMTTLMGDIIEERIGVREAQAVCKAGANLLKIVELTHKYGKPSPKPEQSENAPKMLTLTA